MLQERSWECGRCSQLTAKNEYLRDKIASLEEKLSSLSSENISCWEEVNIKDDKIKKLAKNQMKQETELKDKIIRIEQELLKKDHIIKNQRKEIQELS